MIKLQKATDNYIKAMSTPATSQDEINNALVECYKLLPDSTPEEAGRFMQQVFALSALPDRERAANATKVCGYMVECGFPSEPILNSYLDFYESFLDTSRPFYEEFFLQRQQFDNIDDRDVKDNKTSELFNKLFSDETITSHDIRCAIISLNEFYLCGISIFSTGKENVLAAKKQIGDKVAFIGKYNGGSYWMDILFRTLFDEPVVVIDIDRKIGFKGIINGIVDNYQLQHLIMGMPYMNDNQSAISEENLKVVKGEGEQFLEGATLDNKWNMYNLELCKQADWQEIASNPGSKNIEHTDYWIWSGGTPKDISKHNGARVVLLGAPSYPRSARVQRIFKNLKADIKIEQELSAQEIEGWLNLQN